MKYVSARWIGSNRGDLLSRYGILSALQKIGVKDMVVFCEQKSHVAFLDYPTTPNGRLYNLLLSRDGMRTLRQAQSVLYTAGLDLQDDSSLVKLLHMYTLFLMYRLLNLKIYLLMQGAGPITTKWGRLITRLILDTVEVMVVRDEQSLQLLRSINPRTNLIKGYDGIFAGVIRPQGTPEEEAWIKTLKTEQSERPLIGFNIRRWFHFSNSLLPYQFTQKKYAQRSEQKMAQLIKSAAVFLNALRQKYDARIVMVSMYEPGIDPWEDDLPLLQQIKTEYFGADSEVIVIERPLSLLGFCALISKLDLMVGTRLHSTLTALRFGVPAINLNYTLKGRAIFNDLGFEKQVLELEDFMADPAHALDLAHQALKGVPTRVEIEAQAQKAIDWNENLLRQILQD